jgi:hypothetical protein
MYSRHLVFRLVTSTLYSRCYASTLVLAEQLEGGKLAPVTLNTYDYVNFSFYLIFQ